MAEAQEGIEIPIVLNPDGSVRGLEAIARKLEDLKRAAEGAGKSLDGVGAAAGGQGPGGGRTGMAGGQAGGGNFFESRMGAFTTKVAMAGLSFVERALPNIMDPTQSKIEAAMAAGPHAARLSAQMATGGSLAAAEAKSGIELPETLKQQIIETAGVAAEEAAKAAFAGLRAEIETARGGAMSMLTPFAQMGHMPDEDTVGEIINSFRAVGRREFALRKMIAERLDASVVYPVDDTTMKQLNGVSMPDVGSIIDSGLSSLMGR